jgi:hypothetical protein
VPPDAGDEAVSLLAERHPGAALIGEATDRAGLVELPVVGLAGHGGGHFAAL